GREGELLVGELRRHGGEGEALEPVPLDALDEGFDIAQALEVEVLRGRAGCDRERGEQRREGECGGAHTGNLPYHAALMMRVRTKPIWMRLFNRQAIVAFFGSVYFPPGLRERLEREDPEGLADILDH